MRGSETIHTSYYGPEKYPASRANQLFMDLVKCEDISKIIKIIKNRTPCWVTLLASHMNKRLKSFSGKGIPERGFEI